MLRELLSRFSHRGIQRLSWSKGPGYFPNWRQNIMPSMWCWFFKHAVMEVTIKSLKKKKFVRSGRVLQDWIVGRESLNKIYVKLGR